MAPTQSLEFLGFMINSLNRELRLPPEELKKIWVESWKLLEVELVSALQAGWENERHQPSDPTSSTVLQTLTDGPAL
jgi:hypothetical protein